MGRLNQQSSRMILLLTFLFISSSLAATLPEGVDDLDNVTLEEFLEDFGLDEVDDPEEMAAMAEALAENEEMIKEANEAYANGEQTWFDEVNEFDDEPEDEFIAEHTGILTNFTTDGFGRGILDIPIEYDEASERYFDQFRYSRSDIPESYNAVAEGLVTPIRNQGACGSCAAFATMALVETCFKKATGKFGDYSEQLLVDCGYGYQNLNNGCKGAMPHGYAKWLVDQKPKLSSETDYPYTDANNVAWNTMLTETDPKTCKKPYKPFSQGAVLNNYFVTGSGDEETLKRLVYEHGAVLTTIKAHSGFANYRGGIYEGCVPGERQDHGVAVVGYGSENGVDYWLVKNSWGTDKGENGYYRLQRGVKMCGIGEVLVTLSCAKEEGGTTSAPTAPTAPTASTTESTTSCADKYPLCSSYESACSWSADVKEMCPETCGLCSGATTSTTTTITTTPESCADKDPACPFNKWMCSWSADVKESCPETCGLCSSGCKDDNPLCSSLAMVSCNIWGDQCKKSCNRC